MGQGIRWEQRFSNYQKALEQLEEFIEKGNLSKLEKQGLIKAFEYTYELAWNTMKDFLEDRGQTGIYGSRDVIRKAFRFDLIRDGKNWMEMIKDRNRTSHSYDEDIANSIAERISTVYYMLFENLKSEMLGKISTGDLLAKNHKNSDAGLDSETIIKIKTVFEKFAEIDEVILYGSRAKGDYKNSSDIDITLKGNSISLSTLNEIALMIDDLLLPYSFDISVYNNIDNSDLIEHINRVGKLFYKKNN